MLTVGAQASRDPLDALAVEQTDGRIAQQRQDDRSLADMDQAGILTERDVFAPVQPVLNRPVPASQR